MTATGLSATPDQYRQRLDEQSDEAIDAWVAELMRDMSIRRGVLRVLEDFRRAAGVDDTALERLYAAGGGPPAAVGRTSDGALMVPAISLHHFVSGARSQLPDARMRLTRYLVDSFHEIVFI
ncbi:MAG TPA: hypothetical protein VNW68_01005 [Candidatus Limnocylindria bacterium]|jgi:hypothetical protein|nr:hypothetical protein [Candidatus Limnocylindria bacterium]